jgi:uncharacterized protein YndB with AHSA1/START domain
MEKTVITIEALIEAPVEKVWDYFYNPAHITQWNQASPDWHCPKSEVDLRAGGKYSSTMAAKDGSFSFDFWGIYDEVDPLKKVGSTIGDGRKWDVFFTSKGDQTLVVESFEAETENPVDMQRIGWQSILNNFKQYTETH